MGFGEFLIGFVLSSSLLVVVVVVVMIIVLMNVFALFVRLLSLWLSPPPFLLYFSFSHPPPICFTTSSPHLFPTTPQRNLDQELYQFGGEKHSVDVVGVQWSPHCETVLASWGFDRRVHIWDLARVNMKLSEEDKKDGPPELLFIHGGHTANVSDLCWNPSDEWIVATVAEDNILQIWQMAENIHSDNGMAVDTGVEP